MGTLAGLLVGMGLLYAFWPRPVAVDLVHAERGPMMVTIDEEGETRVDDVYVVSTPVAGRVLRIEGEVGDTVIADQTVLATLRETEPAFLNMRDRRQAEAEVGAAEAALTLAKAQVQRAEAELEFARSDLERAQGLAPGETISERTLDRARLEVRTGIAAVASAQAELRVRESELETARAALIEPGFDPIARVELLAPVSGRILRIMDESERVVAAGTPLLEIGDPSALEVVVDLLSQDAVRVPTGAQVMIEDWGGGARLHGRVQRVEPYGFTKVSALGIEEQRVNVVIDFDDPAAARDALGHGYRVMAKIVVWSADDVVVVPVGALFRSGDAWSVYVDEAGRARLREVSIGHRNNLQAEVVGGLAPGEAIVLHPSDRIAQGVRIQARGVPQ
ncbi:MAG: efflux RND transporter periplasmic adaptor subunit [Pseudomonadota bacterium]